MAAKRQDPWSPRPACIYCSKALESIHDDNQIWAQLSHLPRFEAGNYCSPECYLGDSIHFLIGREYQAAKRDIQLNLGRLVQPFDRKTFKAPQRDDCNEFSEANKRMRQDPQSE